MQDKPTRNSQTISSLLCLNLSNCLSMKSSLWQQFSLWLCQTSGKQKRTSWGNKDIEVILETNHNLCAVSWYNHWSGTLLFHFDGSYADDPRFPSRTTPPGSTVKWAAHLFNWFMGGIDLFDSFTANYKSHSGGICTLLGTPLSLEWPCLAWNTCVTVEPCRSLKKKSLIGCTSQAQPSAVQINIFKSGSSSINKARAQKPMCEKGGPQFFLS